MKGGELLRKGFATAAANTETNFNLDVEIKRDGGATILTNTANPAPTAVTTNSQVTPK